MDKESEMKRLDEDLSIDMKFNEHFDPSCSRRNRRKQSTIYIDEFVDLVWMFETALITAASVVIFHVQCVKVRNVG